MYRFAKNRSLRGWYRGELHGRRRRRHYYYTSAWNEVRVYVAEGLGIGVGIEGWSVRWQNLRKKVRCRFFGGMVTKTGIPGIVLGTRNRKSIY